LGDLADEAGELPAVEQELSIPLWIVVRVGPVAVRADVAAEEPALVVPDGRVRVLEGHLAGAERLHLRAAQHQPRLDGLEDLVLVPRAPVGGAGALLSAPVGLTGHVRK